MTIIRIDAGWILQAPDGSIAAGPYLINSDAWRALDRLDYKHLAMVEASRRIKVAFSE